MRSSRSSLRSELRAARGRCRTSPHRRRPRRSPPTRLGGAAEHITPPTPHELILAALSRSELVPSPSDRNYRNKMVYSLGPDAPPPSECTLGLPAVARTGAFVAEWWRSMSDWPELYREVTVRVSRRGGIQLKLLLQSEAPLNDQNAAWARTRLFGLIGPVESASYQRASGRARPPKDAPLTLLYGAERLLEECPCPGGASYLVGPETLSQVNHATGAALIRRVSEWIGPAPLPNVLVTGRDINCFGFGLVAPRLAAKSRVCLVTHCANAYADAMAKAREATRAPTRLLLEPRRSQSRRSPPGIGHRRSQS